MSINFFFQKSSFLLDAVDVRYFRFLCDFYTCLESNNCFSNNLFKNSVRMGKLQKKLSFYEEIPYMQNFYFFYFCLAI